MILHDSQVLRLATLQALMQTSVVMAVTVASVLGKSLAGEPKWATVPIVLLVVGTAVSSLPAGLAMRRWGRKTIFALGIVIGLTGSLVAAWGLFHNSFIAFVAGHFLLGAYQGIANYYRFAVVEGTSAEASSRAISWVIAGGLVAAFAGPLLGQFGRDGVAGTPFLGSYLWLAALNVVALGVVARLDHCGIPELERSEEVRSAGALLKLPLLQATIFCTAAGFAVMVMVMTATPLAMLGCGLPETSVAPVIQWHVVGMYAPSFFAGTLIARLGAAHIMQWGFVLFVGHIVITLMGNEFLHFLSALILLGVGWNFVFVAGTALLSQSHRPAERAKVQAINEFAIFSLVAISTLSAGWLNETFGWAGLNLALLPLLVLSAVATYRLGQTLKSP